MRARTVLVTGVTGFLGGAVGARLLTDGGDDRLLFLVRADGEPAARARVRGSLARFLAAPALAAGLARAGVVVGDLTELATSRDGRLDEVTHVLHLAGCTSFAAQREARRTNVLGALALAHRLRRVPGLERYLHVGTAYACGDAPARVVHEDDAPDSGHRHVNEYARSKAEAELLLAATAPELPLVIARPSSVIGHTRLGCAPSASIFWYYRALTRLGRAAFPPERRRDVVPVDWVADALVALLFAPRLRERVYHVSAGAHAEAWGDLLAAWARLEPEVAPFRGVCAPDDFAAERPRFAALFGPGDDERLAHALTAFARFGALGIDAFDNRRLLAEGIAAPPRFSSYLPACLAQPAGRGVREQLADD